MSDTIPCETCGTVEALTKDEADEIRRQQKLHPPRFQNKPCPNCIRGRTASPEVLARMVAGAHKPVLVTEDGREFSIAGLLSMDHPELVEAVVLAVWLAEHREDGE